MQKVLITGASGFVGGRLAEYLAARNYHVICTGRRAAMFGAAENRLGDLADAEFAEAVTEGAAAVVHCAGKVGVWGPYEEYHQANYVLTERLLNAAQKNGVARFVFLSTPSVYFDYRDQLDLRESEVPRRFSSHYAKSKYLAEQLVLSAHPQPSVTGSDLRPVVPSVTQTVAIRPRLVLGRGDLQVLPRLVRMNQAGRLIRIGAGNKLIDATSIENLLQAIELCLTCGHQALGQIYNISNGAPTTFGHIAETTLKALGQTPRWRQIPYPAAMLAAKVTEGWAKLRRQQNEPALLPLAVGVATHAMTLNIEKARVKLGYQPRQTLEHAIQEFAHWWRERPSE